MAINSPFLAEYTSRWKQMHKHSGHRSPRQQQTPPIPHVQLVIMVRPFKTQQRVSKWCSVSLIELRPINNNSLAVAFFFLLLETAFSPLQGFTPSSLLLPKDLHGAWQRSCDSLRGNTVRLPLQLRPKHGYFGGKLSGELSCGIRL